MAKANKTKSAGTEAVALPTTEFEVLSPINHDGDDYAVGESIELTDPQAETLLAVKAVKAAPKKAAASAPAPPAA